MDDNTKITNIGPWDDDPLKWAGDPSKPRFAPILNTNDHLTDAQWAAHEASRAIAEGRYRLAESLVALARRAQAAEDAETARSVPYDDPAARLAYVARDSIGTGIATIPVVGSTRVEAPRKDTGPERVSHAPNLCGGIDSDQQSACVQPIGWSAGGYGHPGGWYHLDPEITDHSAFPYVGERGA